MSNHARGLWGYWGQTPSGTELTVQSTGMGGPSAALVLADLAELGVERAVRIGTCTGYPGRSELGELLSVEEVLALGGSAMAFGLDVGDTALPDPPLRAGLEARLDGEARGAIVASLDSTDPETGGVPELIAAVDMQTAALLARGPQLGIAAAALLIVSEVDGERLDDEQLEAAAKSAGRAAAETLN